MIAVAIANVNANICVVVIQLFIHFVVHSVCQVGDQNGIQSEEASNKAPVPQLVKFNRAFKLAEEWVNKMSKLDENDESIKLKTESRPSRLGVGATVPRESKVVHSNDPVERRLRAKLDINKTKVAKNTKEPLRGGSFHEDSDDDELESKAKVFEKKRPVDSASSLQAKKKKK